MHIVPSQAQLQVEGAEVEVDGRELRLCLGVEDVVVALAVDVDVEVVAPEGEAHRGARETARVDGEVGGCHQALAQSGGDLRIDRRRSLQGDGQSGLQGGILLGIEAEAHMETAGFLFAGCQPYHIAGVLRYQMTLCRLVEQVDTHGGRDLLFFGCGDAVEFGEVELLSQEPLILRRHVYELKAYDALFVGHDGRILGMEDCRTERRVDADALFQGDQLVPVAHGLFLAPSDQGVDGGVGEAGCTVAVGIHIHEQIGQRLVLLELVLGVHIEDLGEYALGVPVVIGRHGVVMDGHADHDVGAHLFGDIHGVVVAHAAVDEHQTVDPDRGEDGRDRH